MGRDITWCHMMPPGKVVKVWVASPWNYHASAPWAARRDSEGALPERQEVEGVNPFKCWTLSGPAPNALLTFRLSLNAGNSQILISKANLLSFQTHFPTATWMFTVCQSSPCPKRKPLKYLFFLCIPFPILYIFGQFLFSAWLRVSHFASASGIRKNKTRPRFYSAAFQWG